jgi:signal transduction histidine kinase
VETRAVISARSRRSPPRALYAAGLLAILVAALLGAWFVSGWHDVRLRQAEVRNAPARAAATRADEIGRELRSELEALLAREVKRPYFHYQNLMHDPKASAAVSVSPSPLARGTDDALIAGYFQIDAKGIATTPTINDEVPELSEPERLAENRAFRDQVTHDLVADLRPPPAPVAVLVAEVAKPAPRKAVVQPQTAGEVIEIDPSTYAQNSSSNAIYWQQHDNNNIGAPQLETAREAAPPPPPPQPKAFVKPKPAPTPSPIMISISPLAWETKMFRGAPALLAVRQVQTPDGNFVQGFVVDRSTVTTQLATKAGDMVAELHGGSSPETGIEIAPGWSLTVLPNPRTITHALEEAASIARAFITRFVIVGLIALLVAACILYLVMRAEQLARERSQFAAAAAHELRTPLAGLQLYGDMLADGLGDQAKARDYARRMSEEASRLGRVVSNVLGFSQLERGNLTVNAQVSDLSTALGELAERVQPTLDRAGAALELDVAPDLRAKFDRDALARIIGNLLDNAEKYARDADDRTIRIAAIDRGNAVDVTVTDHGPGIAAKTRLFQPFSRGVAADGPAGLGLGLALSQSLARAMGGELRYATADDGGAEFTLRLPRA